MIGLYLTSPDHAVVFAFDETPQVQALQRAQPILPLDIGQPERQARSSPAPNSSIASRTPWPS